MVTTNTCMCHCTEYRCFFLITSLNHYIHTYSIQFCRVCLSNMHFLFSLSFFLNWLKFEMHENEDDRPIKSHRKRIRRIAWRWKNRQNSIKRTLYAEFLCIYISIKKTLSNWTKSNWFNCECRMVGSMTVERKALLLWVCVVCMIVFIYNRADRWHRFFFFWPFEPTLVRIFSTLSSSQRKSCRRNTYLEQNKKLLTQNRNALRMEGETKTKHNDWYIRWRSVLQFWIHVLKWNGSCVIWVIEENAAYISNFCSVCLSACVRACLQNWYHLYAKHMS